MAKSINVTSSNEVTDALRQLLTLLNTQDTYRRKLDTIYKDSDFLNNVLKKNAETTWLTADTQTTNNIKKELDQNNIPYIIFDEKNTNTSIIIVAKEDEKFLVNLDKNVRIRAGLEIDTPDELRDILAVGSDGQQLYSVDDIDPLVASRVLEMAKGKNIDFPNLTVVSDDFSAKEKEEGVYDSSRRVSLYSSDKFKSLLNQMIINATVDMAGRNKTMVAIKKSMNYYNQQKLEISNAIDNTRLKGVSTPAYIYSFSSPETSIRIDKTSFSVVQDGVDVKRMSKSQLGDYYADTLKATIDNMEHPIYKEASQVQQFNEGRDSVAFLENLKESGDVIENIGIKQNFIDKEIKKWIAHNCRDQFTGTIAIPEDKTELEFIEVEEFKRYLTPTPEMKKIIAENEAYYTNKFNNIKSSMIEYDSLSEVIQKEVNDELGTSERANAQKEAEAIVYNGVQNSIKESKDATAVEITTEQEEMMKTNFEDLGDDER